jgi:RNA polymerase sigma factor (sigma-70 family)
MAMTTTPMIKKQAEVREQRLIALYQNAFPLVARYISRMGGSFEEAKDLFQDALVIYYEKIQSGDVALQYTEKSYLFGIARFLWNKRYQENNNQVPLDQFGAGFDESLNLSDPGYEEVSAPRLLRLLQAAGQKCMELLSAFYYERMDMKEMAERFGFSSPRSATVQKFKCLEKVKETVKEKSLRYEDILE